MNTTGPVAYFFLSKTIERSLQKNDTDAASFRRLAQLADERGIDLRFVLGEASFSQGSFSQYWKIKDGEILHIDESFKPTMLYAKHMSSLFDHVKRVNNALLEKIAIDKLLTAETFPQHIKKTMLIDEDSLAVLDTIRTDMIVVKPRLGSEGKNVHVLPKSEITKELLKDDDYIVQEFIDSSGGIPGLVNQRHEMRIYVFNGVIHSAYIRLPAEDSYLCNVAQGAKEMQITLEQIPDSFITTVAGVDSAFSQINPRHYAIDIMYEKDTPWVVELNNTPGIPATTVQPLADNYFHALLDMVTGKEITGIELRA